MQKKIRAKDFSTNKINELCRNANTKAINYHFVEWFCLKNSEKKDFFNTFFFSNNLNVPSFKYIRKTRMNMVKWVKQVPLLKDIIK